MKKEFIIILIFTSICYSNSLYSQFINKQYQNIFQPKDTLKSVQSKDSVKSILRKSDSNKPGGIFLVPTIGFVFPVKEFKNNSKTGINLGIKLEFASIKIYPLVIGISYNVTKTKGSDEYKTVNLLTAFDTKITSFGGGVDVILSKFLHSNFTIPYIILEGTYYKIKRTVTPTSLTFNPKTEDSFFGITGGFGVTLYIFDIYLKYNFAKEFTNISANLRIRFPVVKF